MPTRWQTARLILGLALAIAAPCRADVTPDDNLQVWNPVVIRGNVHEKVPVMLEVQPRTNLAGSDETNPNAFSLLVIRPMVGYQLNKAVSVWQGYAWAPSFNPQFRNEHRVFQQVQVDKPYKRFSMTNRTRLEERFIEDTGGETAVRARHMLRVMVPLGKQKEGQPKKWSAVASSEAFFNLNSVPTGPQAGFDQMRHFVGLNRKFNKHVNLEAGYMNNYVNRKSPTRDRLNHILLLGLNITVK